MSSDQPSGATGWHRAGFHQLSAATLYGVLRLRAEVFVVEQACVYRDLDGRDLEPGTQHLWVERGGEVAGYLRILEEDGAERRIGRVAVRAAERGQGLAAELMRRALSSCSGGVVLDAQVRLVPWYMRLGFRATGPEYVEDGIAHVPMRLDR